MVIAMKAGSCASAALAVAAAIAGGSPAGAQSVEQFYRDRQISMIVGFGPGGGYDAYTRVLARHIGRHIRAIRKSSSRTCQAPPA